MSELLRDIFSDGVAGIIAEIVFLGVGLWLVMRAIALLSADARRLLTDNDNVVGAITTGGTASLVIATGLFGRLVAADVAHLAGRLSSRR